MAINLEAFEAFAFENQLADEEPELPMVYLPGDFTTTRASAIDLMEILARKNEVFTFGGGLVVVEHDADGVAFLAEVDANALRSLSEKYVKFRLKVPGKKGGPIIEKESLFNLEQAKGIISCKEATRKLLRIKGVTSFPPMNRAGAICASGFNTATGMLVSKSVSLENPSPDEAVGLIRGLLVDWKFASPADESRAVAATLAPMLRLGPWLGDPVVMPIFTIEANASQSGKGMITKAIAAIYNETPTLVVQPKQGVGSFDESFAKALLMGRPIIVLDNLRKRIDSTIVESFTTAGGKVQARAFRSAGEVDSRYYVIYATSNGFESTPDIANRMCMLRILHQPEDYQWHAWNEGSLLKHLAMNRGLYLGAVCSVLRAWIDQGMQSIPCRHDQHEWAGAMNWVVQNVFHLPDLLIPA
jgi:hypothetical protein